jgi:hypothetical protein
MRIWAGLPVQLAASAVAALLRKERMKMLPAVHFSPAKAGNDGLPYQRRMFK